MKESNCKCELLSFFYKNKRAASLSFQIRVSNPVCAYNAFVIINIPYFLKKANKFYAVPPYPHNKP